MEYKEHDIFSNFLNLDMHEMRLWNGVCDHLDLMVHMFAQPFSTIDIFVYDDAIIVWIDDKTRKGFLASYIVLVSLMVH
jgi:hypothetical protein